MLPLFAQDFHLLANGCSGPDIAYTGTGASAGLPTLTGYQKTVKWGCRVETDAGKDGLAQYPPLLCLSCLVRPVLSCPVLSVCVCVCV